MSAHSRWLGPRDTVTARQVVRAPVERACALFIDAFAQGRPGHRGLLATMEIEPELSGRILELEADGSQRQWGSVLAWEPPYYLAFSWTFAPDWDAAPDHTRMSRIAVRFVEDDPGWARIILAHSGLARHGRGWRAIRRALVGEYGWQMFLSRLAEIDHVPRLTHHRFKKP